MVFCEAVYEPPMGECVWRMIALRGINGQVDEPVLVQALIAEVPVEDLDVASDSS
jgi:hypothetical protein